MPYKISCRRPRPTEPPPFLEGKKDETWTNDGLMCLKHKAPRRPLPASAPPPPSHGLSISNQTVVATRDPHSGMLCVGSFKADGDENDVAPKGSVRIQSTRSMPVMRHRPVAHDQLLHSGGWIPPEYRLFHKVPWTGHWTCCGNKSSFTTHCLDFDARMRQRDKEHRREVATHLAPARKESAAQFRLRWESQEPVTADVGNGDDRISVLSKPGAIEHSLQRITTPGCKPRPFLRREWLQRFDKTSGLSYTGVGLTGEEPSHQTNKRPVVTRDHVRSVIQLALSEARANAFVVMSCLDGLLSVASEGTEKGHGLRHVNASAKSTETVGDSTITENGLLCESVSALAEFSALASLDDRTTRTFEGATTTDKRASVADNSCVASGETLSPARTRDSVSHHSIATTGWNTATSHSGGTGDTEPGSNSTGSSEIDGASLCVQLGALPAVLGCLQQHAGHSRIEPQGAALLYLFARDSATRDAVRGNIDVLEACASRMHPGPPLRPTLADASLTSSPVQTSSAQKSTLDSRRGDDDSSSGGDIPDYHRPENVAAPRQNSTAGATSTDGEMNAVVPSTAGESARNERETMERSSSPSVATESSPVAFIKEVANTRSATTEASNVTLPTEEEDTARQRLPAPEVVFVLSVALQDSPECQDMAVRQGGIAAMLATLGCLTCSGTGNGGGGDARLAETCLRVLEHFGEGRKGRRRLVKEGCVDVAITTIGSFRSNEDVLAAAMGLLLLMSDTSKGRRRVLKAGGVRVVFQAMQRLVGNADVQVKGADMLQTLINEEPQARVELDGIKGGWQWLCQGTSGGNALLRYAKGEKHTPGWTMAEEERLSTAQALATAELAAAEWTPFKLAAFMGTARNQHTLQVSNLAYYHYFRVVSEVGLLPDAHEDVEQWRDRMRRYEDERHIRVNNVTRRRLARDTGGAQSLSTSSTSS